MLIAMLSFPGLGAIIEQYNQFWCPGLIACATIRVWVGGEKRNKFEKRKADTFREQFLSNKLVEGDCAGAMLPRSDRQCGSTSLTMPMLGTKAEPSA